MKFSNRIALLALVVVLPQLGCQQASETQSERFPTAEEFRSLFESARLARDDAVHAIEHATRAKQAVVFVDLKWSLNSAVASVKFSQWLAKYYERNPQTEIAFHYIESTSLTRDYSPYTDLPGWNELGAVGKFRPHVSGNGEILWLEEGRVIGFEALGRHFQTKVLDQKTEEYFQ